MKCKLLLWLVMLLCFVATASAYTTWSNFSYDGDYTDGSTGGNDMTAGGAGNLFNATSYVQGNSSLQFNGSGYATDATPNVSTGNHNITFCTWYFFNTNPGAGQHAITLIGDSGNSEAANLWYGSTNDLWFFINNQNNVQVNYVLPANSWNHLCVQYWTNLSVWFYVNGTFVNASTSAGALNMVAGDWHIGAAGGGSNTWAGKIDSVFYSEEILTASEIYALYSPPVATTDVTFSATDDFDGSAINNFTVNLTWSNGTTEQYNTVNGSLPLVNISDVDLTVNVTFWNVTDYYNFTLLDESVTANTTNTITTGMYQAVVSMVAREKISNNSISGSTFYVGSKNGTVFNLTADTHVINFTHNGYYGVNGSSFVISALTNTTQTVSDVYSGVANISVYYPNGTILSDWSINITSLNYTNWTGETGSTTNGSYYFNSINGSYSAIINSTLGEENFTFIVNNASPIVNYYYFGIDNCSTYTDVILNFTIRNEDTEALINNSPLNIWFNITSSSLTSSREFNISFTGPNYYTVCVANNTISSWVADAQATYSNLPTYAEKNYYLVNYSLNSTQQDIDLYLTNGTTQVTLQVRDYVDDPISDVYIKVRTYDVGTNSYRTTEVVKTDGDGDAYAQMVLDTVWYSFILEYQGAVVLQTLPTKITTTTRTFRVNLETDYFASYDVVQGITYSLDYTNSTTTFSYTWSDPTGSVQTGCLDLTRRSINGDTLLNSTCVTSTSSTILMNISDGAVGTNTYIGDAYVTISGQTFHLDSLAVSFNNTFRTFGSSGLFFSFLLILVLVMVGIWSPVVAVVMMVLGVVATNVMGIFYLNWVYIVTLVIMAGITIYRTGKSD